MEEKKRICADCLHWEPGDLWGTGNGNHGVVVESKGWCLAKPNKRKRWNYHPMCDKFKPRKKQGFFYQGGGGNSIEEDLANIALLMKELVK